MLLLLPLSSLPVTSALTPEARSYVGTRHASHVCGLSKSRGIDCAPTQSTTKSGSKMSVTGGDECAARAEVNMSLNAVFDCAASEPSAASASIASARSGSLSLSPIQPRYASAETSVSAQRSAPHGCVFLECEQARAIAWQLVRRMVHTHQRPGVSTMRFMH